MRTPKPALQEQLPSASPFVPACLPPRQHAHLCVHAREMPGASPCTLARVSPSYLHRNVGFAVRIQPDAHLAQHASLSRGEHQQLRDSCRRQAGELCPPLREAGWEQEPETGPSCEVQCQGPLPQHGQA